MKRFSKRYSGRVGIKGGLIISSFMGHKNGEFILDGPFDMSLVCCLMSRERKVEIFKQFHLTISDTSRHEINLKKFNLEIKIHFSAITKRLPRSASRDLIIVTYYFLKIIESNLFWTLISSFSKHLGNLCLFFSHLFLSLFISISPTEREATQFFSMLIW